MARRVSLLQGRIPTGLGDAGAKKPRSDSEGLRGRGGRVYPHRSRVLDSHGGGLYRLGVAHPVAWVVDGAKNMEKSNAPRSVEHCRNARARTLVAVGEIRGSVRRIREIFSRMQRFPVDPPGSCTRFSPGASPQEPGGLDGLSQWEPRLESLRRGVDE